eukprot:TRINITY_DN8665_c0_g1_i1.p2 TRINITY_DN8665_c0_g1~~TRINITY_DN8665_c0_g1_i1.p2  ORF type:complete len:294 (+),score=15.36 TRINITY_DN8665_c0_g1_i1:90-971(+)
MAMIRHEYKGFGLAPGPPQMPSLFTGIQKADVDATSREDDAAVKEGPLPSGVARGPMVPVERPVAPTKHTQYPYVTGASVLAVKFKDGILMATDTMGAYGRTMRYKSVERMKQVAPLTVLGAGGEISDFAFIQSLYEELLTNDYAFDDGHVMGTSEVFAYLTRVMYNRRNKFDPLWNSLVVGGIDNGKPFLGFVSMIGVHFMDDHIATGYGAHLVRPLMRSEQRNDMDEAAAVRLLEKGLRVLYARDSGALNKVQISKVTKEGVTISKPYSINIEWNYSHFQNAVPDPFSGSW